MKGKELTYEQFCNMNKGDKFCLIPKENHKDIIPWCLSKNVTINPLDIPCLFDIYEWIGDEEPNKETINKNINKENIKQYQIERAKEYLEKHNSNNGSEPPIEWCIISDLIRIIENN